MLKDAGIEYRYREYREDMLSPDEIRGVLRMLDMGPKDVLRTNDRAFKTLGLTGEEADDELIDLMSRHPTLLQRPIGVFNGMAVVGRPAERILQLMR